LRCKFQNIKGVDILDTFLTILIGIGIIIAIIAVLVLICFLGVSAIYESVFGKRFEIYDSPLLPDFNDYPGLESEHVSFPSKKGYNHIGTFYHHKDVTKFKGLIVFSHGIFDGQLNYLPEIDYFARRGYKVFGFDNTGSHLSGGKSLRGLPQSAEDLDTALAYVTEVTKDEKLPLFLFGHSWGGYAVSAVSCYNLYDIKGVFVQNGFNRCCDMLTAEAVKRFGKWMLALTPYIRMYEKMKFGKAADYTAMQGVAKATSNGTKFLILHSLDDKSISLTNSVLSNVIKNDNITLITEKHKGHNSLDSDKAIKYKKKLDDMCYDELGKNPTSTAKREFYQKNADKKTYFEIDFRLMKIIADFYEAGCR